jgi:glc operon protein GlcG
MKKLSHFARHLATLSLSIATLVWIPHTHGQTSNHSPEAPIASTLALPYGKDISMETANKAMAAAIAHAQKNKWTVSVVVVDAGGRMVAMSRMDGAHKATPDFAFAKADSAVMTKRSTKVFSDHLSAGRNAILGFTNLHVHVAEGGEVILQNGLIVGAIGVAGVTQQQDRETALAGVTAVN